MDSLADRIRKAGKLPRQLALLAKDEYRNSEGLSGRIGGARRPGAKICHGTVVQKAEKLRGTGKKGGKAFCLLNLLR